MPVQQFSRADLDAAAEAGDYVIVDFYADWCGPCKVMAPHFAAASDGDAGAKATFAKIDTEQEQALAREAGVQSIPTTVVFAGFDEIARTTGAMNRRQIEQFVADAIWQRENI